MTLSPSQAVITAANPARKISKSFGIEEVERGVFICMQVYLVETIRHSVEWTPDVKRD